MEDGELLCEAAKNGDAEKVRALIISGADVSYFDTEGFTPLMHAAKHGHADVVKILLEAGAPWNALSRSNVSAGDLAMAAGHQEAFDYLLNAGMQAELVLGTIARRANKDTDLGEVYLKDRITFSEDKLMDSNSKAIMMAWEKPLMEAHAKAVCSQGGDVLNIGFGMGLVDTAIQQYEHVTHTIIEAHPEVYNRMLLSGWGDKKNVKIIFGRWQDVISELKSYDGSGCGKRGGIGKGKRRAAKGLHWINSTIFLKHRVSVEFKGAKISKHSFLGFLQLDHSIWYLTFVLILILVIILA